MLTLPLFALAILASGSPLDDSSPKVVALRFMALIKAKDWKAATAMLTDDAQFVVGHVGGPLNTETIPITDTVNSTKVTCTLLDTTQTDDRLPGHPEMSFVESRYQCLKEGGPQTHELRITYFVKGQKIAGYMLNSGARPPQ